VTAGAASIGLALLAGLLVAEPRAGVDRLARLTTGAIPGATDPAPGIGPPVWPARLTAGAAGVGLLSGHTAEAVAMAVLAVALGAPAVRAARAERLRRAVLLADLPRAAELLATCLEAGASPAAALSAVADAVGGPLAGRLRGVVAFLRSGTDLAHWPANPAAPVDPVDPVDRLVRAVARASRTGAPMAESVRLLAADEAERARWDALERARRAGVQAVGPLAACFLPAFVLLGVVPMIVGVSRTVLTGWT
jgi:pilus assembly protein TadC